MTNRPQPDPNRDWNKEPWFQGGDSLETGVFNANKCKMLREKRGITVEELASWAKILPSELLEIESYTRPPTKKTAEFLVAGVTGKKEI